MTYLSSASSAPSIREHGPRFTHHFRRRPVCSVELLLLLGVSLLTIFANQSFWSIVLQAGSSNSAPWRVASLVLVGVIGVQFALLLPLASRFTVRPLLSLLGFTAVISAHFIQQYGVVIDPSMLRNAMRTDAREASELFNHAFLIALFIAVGVAVVPWSIQPRAPTSFFSALKRRLLWIVIAFCIGGGALWASFHDVSSLVRERRELRYLLTPANSVYSFIRVVASDTHEASIKKDPPEPLSRLASAQQKPLLFVLVVGETVRAANFGLNGYARNTTPQLAQLPVINFPHMRACGTSTEVSLPCMFSPYGRADYDEARIKRHESLLQMLGRAGVRVVWLDNQSGCKGVCAGLESRDLTQAKVAGLCQGGYCLDEVLLNELKTVAQQHEHRSDLMVVLHPLGNHGPAYFRRYPAAFERFVPPCRSLELKDCSKEEIVNAYDNAVLYTDYWLAGTIRYLDSVRDRYDVALAYLSDHGESLGERGLFLHGMPYAIAPREQLEVPMLWWFGEQTPARFGLDVSCFKQRAQQPASHDLLFHSVLGLLDVQINSYQAGRDLFAGCRTKAP